MYIASGRDPVVVKVPVSAASTAIVQGALIMPGVTADTDLGLFVLGASAAADALGVIRGPFAVADNASVLGTKWTLADVELFDQYTPVMVEYDQSDTMAVASNSGTTLTITSLEDNIDTSWFYAVSGTNSGKLSFLVSSASGSATQKTAMGYASDTTGIKILRLGHQVAKLNTAGTKIGTDAAAGTWTVCILENYIDAPQNGIQMALLDPTKHDDLTLTSPRFYAKLLVRNTAGHTID